MKDKRITAAAVVILVVLVILFLRIRGGGRHAVKHTVVPAVTVAYPEPTDLDKTIGLTGSIMAIQQAGIYARVGGYLEKITVDIGDRVRAGQVLAVINYKDLQNQYEQAKANFDYASIQYERAKKLIGKELISQSDLDTAKNQFSVTQAQMNVAALNLSYATIRAPFSGYVANRYVDPGTLIPGSTQMVPANPLLVLVDINTVKIMINVSERDVANVRKGMPVTVVTDAYPGRIFRGSISRTAPALDPATRTMAVEVDIPNHGLLLKPGMFSRVNIVSVSRKGVLAVPVSAIVHADDRANLFLVESGKAVLVPVEEGIETGGMVEITKGVSQGSAVVVEGQEALHEGEAVTIQQKGEGSR